MAYHDAGGGTNGSGGGALAYDEMVTAKMFVPTSSHLQRCLLSHIECGHNPKESHHGSSQIQDIAITASLTLAGAAGH